MESSDAPELDRGGSGDLTLVLLHGWGLDRESWRPLRRHLDPHVETVAYDMWGFGSNAGGEEIPVEGSLSRSVTELLRVCDQLSDRQLVLVGASRGGTVALRAAAEHPERFAGVVTIAAPPRGSAADDYPFGADRARMEEVILQLKRDYAGTMATAGPAFYVSDDAPDADHATAIEEIRASTERTRRPDLAVEILGESLSDDIRHLLPLVRVPVLVVATERDVAVSPEAGRLIADSIPSARFQLIRGAGHVPQLTMPRPLAATILKFLEEQVPGTRNREES